MGLKLGYGGMEVGRIGGGEGYMGVIPRGHMKISEKILGNFHDNSGECTEIVGDTRGVQHDIVQ